MNDTNNDNIEPNPTPSGKENKPKKVKKESIVPDKGINDLDEQHRVLRPMHISLRDMQPDDVMLIYPITISLEKLRGRFYTSTQKLFPKKFATEITPVALEVRRTV